MQGLHEGTPSLEVSFKMQTSTIETDIAVDLG